jgi:16S rRNA (guanine527-N7)-methyltransferase
MDINFYKKVVEEDYAQQFEKLYNLLIEYNNMYNLTAITDKDDVYLKHFIDSVVGEKYFTNNCKVVEIGSGGGFPSIPLKIIRDDLSFTLIESTGKKCNYLNNCVDNFEFSKVKVMNIRAEDGARDKLLRSKFDVAVARAVARLNILSEYCLPYVKKGGRFIAYKGDADDEIKEAENAIKILGGEVECVEKFDLFDCGKRTLVVIRKVKDTPEKYPRGNGQERKKPL